MTGPSLRLAAWHRRSPGFGVPADLLPWLTEAGSLTARLQAHSRHFRVQRLHQRSALCLADEAAAIGMARPGRVWEREVLLKTDRQAVVFAHTVVPLTASASDWPLFSALGERSLGSTLFGDRRVSRGELEFARLRAGHPLMRRARAALGLGEQEGAAELHARRCLYRRRQGLLLVTEVFLPAVRALTRGGAIEMYPNNIL